MTCFRVYNYFNDECQGAINSMYLDSTMLTKYLVRMMRTHSTDDAKHYLKKIKEYIEYLTLAVNTTYDDMLLIVEPLSDYPDKE